MRIMFTGAASWANSGYSKPLRNLLPRLAEQGHVLAQCCFFGYQGPNTVLTVGTQDHRCDVMHFGPARDGYFNDLIEMNYQGFEADCLITLQDVWVLSGWGQRGMTWLPWMPVDSNTVPARVLNAIQDCWAPLSYSNAGAELLRQAGWSNARWMPCGVDLQVHQIRDREEARRAVGLPEGGFIAGMVAGNSSFPSRKSFPEVLMAWKRYLDGGGKGLLYLHTTITPKQGRQAGLEFVPLLDAIGLDWSTLDDPEEWRRQEATVVFPCQHRMWNQAYHDEDLALLYSAMDVLLSPSMGEGFGIPILEAQACGVPVVTLNTTSMPEITFAGRCLEPIQKWWCEQDAWRSIAPIGELADTIALFAEMDGEQKAALAQKARAGVEPFEWDVLVRDRWTPLLAEVEAANG